MPRMRPGKTSGWWRAARPASRRRAPHREPCGREGQRDRDSRGRDRDQQRVGGEPELIGVQHGAVIIERHEFHRGRAHWLIERQQRHPDEHCDRHEQKQHEIDDERGRGRVAQPPEIEWPRPESLAGDGRESLRMPRQPAVDIEQHQDEQQHQHRERARAADIGRRARHHVAVDVGGQNRDAARQPDQRRHLECLDGADEDQHRQRQDRGQRQPHGDAPDRLPHAGAAHARGFLELGVGIAQRRAHQQERERRPQKSFDQDHSGHGVDVDQHVGCAGEMAIELIDRPGLAEHQQPGTDIENVRSSKRDDRGEIGERLERRVGALDDPGADPADHNRYRRAAGREYERVDARCDKAPAAEHGREIPDAPLYAALRIGDQNACLDEKQERRQH